MELKVRPASTKYELFETPSHNIGCVYDTLNLHLRCDIRSGLRPAPHKPPGCQNDWTFGYQMDPAGRAHKVCAGDTVLSASARVVRYGTTAAVLLPANRAVQDSDARTVSAMASS
jgi:hypothetical protein